jgi:murein L,D-transpeptidase YcbB/YkuD
MRVAMLMGIVCAVLAPAGRQTGFRAFVAPLVDGRDAWLGRVSREERSDLQRLYASVDAPLWLDASGMPTTNTRDALAVLRQAADEGLDPADYHPDLLARLIPRAGTPADGPDRARFDVALSASVLRYLRDLHGGRVDPRTVGFRLDAPRDPHDFPSLLRAALAGRRVAGLVDDLRPQPAQYRHLRAMLPRYRSLADGPALAGAASLAETIRPGDESDAVGVLRQILIALGDLPATAPATAHYDGPLVDAVERFQRRHGLDADGIVGKRTIEALRVPATTRVRQIELALERLRWLPDLRDDRLIALNSPMFRPWAWGRVPPAGQPPIAMNVIVGRALRNQTPIFDEEMREVVFRPYWNVPRSILLNEVLPAIQRNPAYLRRENMEIVRGPGDDARPVPLSAEALEELRRGTLRVRQRPGPNNALGLVKFVFPNRESVYMHGTPAQTLFARSRRDFSHGCVRLDDPVALAEWVLRDRPEWTRDAILKAMQGTRTLYVPLTRPIQVILFYTTAVVMPEDGAIHFLEDIYRHDARLDQALDARRQVRQRGIFRPAGKFPRPR